ncbi:hypothetical protein ACJJTC_014974 [Scirpophaga incertulas]
MRRHQNTPDIWISVHIRQVQLIDVLERIQALSVQYLCVARTVTNWMTQPIRSGTQGLPDVNGAVSRRGGHSSKRRARRHQVDGLANARPKQIILFLTRVDRLHCNWSSCGIPPQSAPPAAPHAAPHPAPLKAVARP